MVRNTSLTVCKAKGAASASIVDVSTGQILKTLPTGEGPHEVVVSADGATAVVTDYGGRSGGNTLTVIDLGTGATVFTTTGDNSSRISRDGSRLLAGGQKLISLWRQ